MGDRMLSASTELTHDQASRNWGGGGVGGLRSTKGQPDRRCID